MATKWCETITDFHRGVAEFPHCRDLIPRRFVVGYQRFGTAYRSHLRTDQLSLEYGTGKVSRNVGNQVSA
jgi:hypothetical protein